MEIDDTVENQLILILEDSLNPGLQRRAVIKDSWLQTVFNEKDILHLEGDWVQDVININDKAGNLNLFTLPPYDQHYQSMIPPTE